jgi:hypothetical protein
LDTEPIIQHWLVQVAKAANLTNADTLSVASDTEPPAAWDVVSMRTGVSTDDLAQCVAANYHLEVADLAGTDPPAHKLVPGVVARKLNVVPLGYSDAQIIVATADPVSLESERKIRNIATRTVKFRVAPPDSLASAIEEWYPEDGALIHEVPPPTAEAKGGPHVLVVDDDEAM